MAPYRRFFAHIVAYFAGKLEIDPVPVTGYLIALDRDARRRPEMNAVA
jgi:hypothetical protein